MSEPTRLKTARGVYRLSVAEEAWSDGGACTVTLAAEHAGGLEKFGFRCRIAESLAASRDKQALGARLAGWLEGNFEAVREAALKAVRSEHRLAEFEFHEGRPGPFKVIT
jgi:hypothetical protein